MTLAVTLSWNTHIHTRAHTYTHTHTHTCTRLRKYLLEEPVASNNDNAIDSVEICFSAKATSQTLGYMRWPHARPSSLTLVDSERLS